MVVSLKYLASKTWYITTLFHYLAGGARPEKF